MKILKREGRHSSGQNAARPADLMPGPAIVKRQLSGRIDGLRQFSSVTDTLLWWTIIPHFGMKLSARAQNR